MNDFIPNGFFQEDYAKDYHIQNIINTYSSTTTNNNTVLTQLINPNLILEKEKYETSKRFLNDYMLYLLSKKFPIILNNFNSVNSFYQIVTSTHDNITSLQNKMKTIKSNLLNIISLIYLKKQKIYNCKKVLMHLKVINKWKEEYFISTNPVQIKELSFGDIINLLKEINNSKVSEKSRIAYLLTENISKQKHKHKSHLDEEFMTIFVTLKKEIEIKSLYEKYTILTNNQNIISFINNVITSFNKTLFKVMKSSILSYGTLDIQSNVNSTLINSLDMLKHVKFDDEKLFLCFQQICLNILNMITIYNKYLSYQEISFGKELKAKKCIVVQNIISKIIELIDLFMNKIASCLKRKYTYLIIACLCIFNRTLNVFCDLNNDEIKGVSLHYKINFVIKYVIFEELKAMLNKTKVLLSNDNWKRIPNFSYDNIIKNHSSYLEQTIPYIQLLYNNNNSKFTIDNLYNLILKINPTDKVKEISKSKVNVTLNKQISSSKLIFSSSVINIINFIIDFIKYDSIFPNLTNELYSYIFMLFEYFIIGGLYMFIPASQIQFLLNKTLSLNNLLTYDQIERLHSETLYIKRYLNLRNLIRDTHIKIIDKIFNKKLKLSDILPQLSSDILQNVTNVYSCLIEKIIFYETTKTLYKFIKHTIPKHKQSILQSTISKLSHYKTVLSELKEFLYYPSCQKIFNIQPMIYTLNTKNWCLFEVESGSRFNDANEYAYNIIEEMNEKYQHLSLLSSDTLTLQAKQRYILVGIYYLIKELFNSISRIERFSSVGRGILLRDITFINNYFTDVMNVNTNPLFEDLMQYIKAWYYDENELIQFANKSSIEFKYINMLIENGCVIGKADSVKKTKLKQTIANIVIQKIQLFLNSFR